MTKLEPSILPTRLRPVWWRAILAACVVVGFAGAATISIALTQRDPYPTVVPAPLDPWSESPCASRTYYYDMAPFVRTRTWCPVGTERYR